ncbi:MAG: sulfatase [Gemmataceae bacterium]|nr:sulfatase [Gemmataceae bacterium]
MIRFYCFALLVALAFPSWADAQTKRKPNIVVILADDMGYADVGFHGCKDIPTPHIDALAKRGVRFTNAYVSGPYCSPTRAGLLTGRYQNRFGHEYNPGAKGDNVGMPVSETTLANRLKAAGYVTALIGKWHLGAAAQFHPQERGFDEFFGFLGGAHTYFADKGAPILRGKTPVAEKEYLTDAFAREANAFIERHKDRPFFLYLSFNAVHTPMDATKDRLQKFAGIADKTRRTYAAMLSAMDDAVGQVLRKLSDAGLEEDTLIFFFSDNGGPTMPGTTVNGSRNTPLRGSKRTTLDGGIRVPFVIAWKGKLPAGKIVDSPIIQLDVLPTALAAAGVEIKEGWKLDGVNLLPYLKGPQLKEPHETLYWRFGQQMAIRSGNWMLVRYDTAVESGKKSGKKGKAPVSAARLYNLADDIGQTKDLAAEQPDRVRHLQDMWEQWNAQLARPLWGAGSKAPASSP